MFFVTGFEGQNSSNDVINNTIPYTLMIVWQGFGPILWNVFGSKGNFAVNIDAGSPAKNDRFASEIPATIRRLAHDPDQAPERTNYIQ